MTLCCAVFFLVSVLVWPCLASACLVMSCFKGWGNSRGIYQTWQFFPAFSGVLVTATAFVSPRSAGWTDSRLRTSIRDPKMHVFLVKLRMPRLVNATSVPPPYEHYSLVCVCFCEHDCSNVNFTLTRVLCSDTNLEVSH